MSQYLPKDGFSWYEGDMGIEYVLKYLNNFNETSGIGYVLEIDALYPPTLHNAHNDLP